ncbi:MAG: hypothetical protein FWE57_05625 [Chitinispirillia bacterium]|nr:hypothetical protein [Chitinispirillia bacterium]
MIHINSSGLYVSLLDPRIDIDKLGSRYCTGGYIWQVSNAAGRSLLSGPQFPSQTPPVFDGQGMPEVFEIPLGGDKAPLGKDVCVTGVGFVKKTSDIEPFHPRNNPQVTKFCSWDIEHGNNFAVMSTKQSYENKSIELRREVRVDDKIIVSKTHIKNTGNDEITLRWFSHPFFPLNANLACGKISPNTTPNNMRSNATPSPNMPNVSSNATPSPSILPQSIGYRMDDENGMIFMKEDYPWQKGLFQLLNVPETKLSFDIPHPVCKSIKIECDYNVIRCALWANANTFSFEPFLQRVLKAGQDSEWQISVCFS